MDFITVMKEYGRMCKNMPSCSLCPLNRMTCHGNSFKYYDEPQLEKINTVVEQWSKEHPIKTYKMDFSEKFPKAQIHLDVTPVSNFYGKCPITCDRPSEQHKPCRDCWNAPYEDKGE